MSWPSAWAWIGQWGGAKEDRGKVERDRDNAGRGRQLPAPQGDQKLNRAPNSRITPSASVGTEMPPTREILSLAR